MKKPSVPATSTKPQDKPSGKPAGAGKKPDDALPDAALLDREGEEGDEAASGTGRSGLRRFLPNSKLGWALAAPLLIAILGGGATAAIFLTPAKSPAPAPGITGLARVIDGATLVVAGQTVHLQGIEAPPASLVCREGGWTYKCGEESRKALEQTIANHAIDCDPVSTSSGNVVGQCYSDQGIDLAAALVENGWAVADLKRSSRYMPQQAKARDEGRGLWRNDFAHPEQWRLAARSETR